MKNLCLNCFRNLSVDSRFKIYEFIKNNKNVCVTHIIEQVNLKQPTVSYHLTEMQNSGLIKKIHKGNKVYLKINKICPHDDHKCLVH